MWQIFVIGLDSRSVTIDVYLKLNMLFLFKTYSVFNQYWSKIRRFFLESRPLTGLFAVYSLFKLISFGVAIH
jgi:hypothetical protein